MVGKVRKTGEVGRAKEKYGTGCIEKKVLRVAEVGWTEVERLTSERRGW